MSELPAHLFDSGDTNVLLPSELVLASLEPDPGSVLNHLFILKGYEDTVV